jgi:hypothetical protein
MQSLNVARWSMLVCLTERLTPIQNVFCGIILIYNNSTSSSQTEIREPSIPSTAILKKPEIFGIVVDQDAASTTMDVSIKNIWAIHDACRRKETLENKLYCFNYSILGNNRGILKRFKIRAGYLDPSAPDVDYGSLFLRGCVLDIVAQSKPGPVHD